MGIHDDDVLPETHKTRNEPEEERRRGPRRGRGRGGRGRGRREEAQVETKEEWIIYSWIDLFRVN